MTVKQFGLLLTAAALALSSLTACARSQPVAGGTLAVAPVTARAPQASTPKASANPTEKNTRQIQPSLENMLETVGSLCKQSRYLGSQAERDAAQYLSKRLAGYGYQSQLEAFPFNLLSVTRTERYRQARESSGENFFAAAALERKTPQGYSQNVIGKQAGEDKKEKILVLSAHYDSTYGSVGAIDNATGVAVVLEAARILAAEDLPFAIRVALFGGEEEILVGSQQHVLSLSTKEIGRIVANINVDTLAYSGKEEFAVLTPLALKQEDAATLKQASPAAAALLADKRVTPAFSSKLVGDFMSFSAVGIDSVNFGQSMDAVSDIINSPKDTYDLIKPEILPVATQMVVDAVHRLAEQMKTQG